MSKKKHRSNDEPASENPSETGKPTAEETPPADEKPKDFSNQPGASGTTIAGPPQPAGEPSASETVTTTDPQAEAERSASEHENV
jgi:hypothetical protein